MHPNGVVVEIVIRLAERRETDGVDCPFHGSMPSGASA
jgi:hypothetical protein